MNFNAKVINKTYCAKFFHSKYPLSANFFYPKYPLSAKFVAQKKHASGWMHAFLCDRLCVR